MIGENRENVFSLIFLRFLRISKNRLNTSLTLSKNETADLFANKAPIGTLPKYNFNS